MMTHVIADCKNWIKRREHPVARLLYGIARGGAVPYVAIFHRPLYRVHVWIRSLVTDGIRRFYTTPLFQSRLTQPARQLYLYGGLPYLCGNVDITLGERCRVSGKTTISGRPSTSKPQFVVGSNCDIGWQTTIAVGQRIELGDNVRMAGQCFLAGYPGHPLDAADRAAGLPDTEDQIGDIILENDVWLGTGVTVLAGVRIGEGSIIGAGSVVTKDMPAYVMAAGVPAKVMRKLDHG